MGFMVSMYIKTEIPERISSYFEEALELRQKHCIRGFASI
jgi:hypothetical protein